MHSNRVKEVLNKMDYNLKEIFETVEINRLENQRELTFEVKLKGFKSDPNNKAELVMYMTESTIYESSMIWKYKSNPLNENSMYITRTSTLNSMAMDIEDILTENRFATEYLDTLLESVNESVETEEKTTEIESIDESFEFDFDEDVVFEGTEATIIDREKLVVESVEYNVYQVYIDGVQKSIFEYDLKKK